MKTFGFLIILGLLAPSLGGCAVTHGVAASVASSVGPQTM